MDMAGRITPDIPAMSPGFPVDEFAMVVGSCREQVSVHIFRTPLRSDGTHLFLYEHIRCAPSQVFASGSTVFIRPEGVDGEMMSFSLGEDIGPCQVDMSGDTPYDDQPEMIAFISEHLADLKRDTLNKGLPKLVMREGENHEVYVDPRSLVIHAEGIFRIGHGWLMRWRDVAEVCAPRTEGAAADLRIYATDGHLVSLRIDLV